jgi:signal transduction histidine kinase
MAGAFNRMAHRVENRELENLALSEGLRRQSALRGELFKRLITAQEDERKRLARELHDELGQALTGLIFRAEAMGELFSIDPGSAHEILVEIRSLAGETSQIMYELIMDLRPAALDDLGLAAAIRAYAERLLADTKTTFVLDTNGLQDRLPPALETTMYRVFQEALSNVVRHAGAGRVQITLRKCDSVFEGEIADNGKGFALESINMNGKSSRGLGLLGMQERVAQCGGYMDIVSRPGSGTRIMVRLPLKEVAGG